MSSEFERIRRLTTILDQPSALIPLGIGDDAAVVSHPAFGSANSVWTIDTCVEGVHFRTDWLDWHDVGWRSFMAAVSDVAAMGAVPVAALSSLILRSDLAEKAWEQILLGQRDAAQAAKTPIVGGNLSRGSEVSITTTIWGCCDQPVLRSGARPGDLVVLFGPVGYAGLGLRILSEQVPITSEVRQRAVHAWRTPVAQIAYGVRIADVAHAMIDVSDGLVQDAMHMAQASGAAIELEEERLRDPDMEKECEGLGWSWRKFVLGGGEDYALVIAIPRDCVPNDARVVGRVVEGNGVWMRTLNGVHALDESGHDHFVGE